MSDRPSVSPPENHHPFAYPAYHQADSLATRSTQPNYDQAEPDPEIFPRTRQYAGVVVAREAVAIARSIATGPGPEGTTDTQSAHRNQADTPEDAVNDNQSRPPERSEPDSPPTGASGGGRGPNGPPDNDPPPGQKQPDIPDENEPEEPDAHDVAHTAGQTALDTVLGEAETTSPELQPQQEDSGSRKSSRSDESEITGSGGTSADKSWHTSGLEVRPTSNEPPADTPHDHEAGNPSMKEVRTPQQVRDSPPDAHTGLAETYHNLLHQYATAVQAPTAYAHGVFVTDNPQVEHVHVGPLLATFYGLERDHRREETINAITNAGLKLLGSGLPSIGSTIKEAGVVLAGTQELVQHMRYIEGAQAKPIFASQMTGLQRKLALEGMREINRGPRSPLLSAYQRLGIPRFAHHPHPMPEVPVPEEYQARLHQLWTDHTPQDVNLLASPEDLAAGTLPLHAAIEAARTAQAEGQVDVGYAIKTSIMLDTLDMEHERFMNPVADRVEIPFFRYIFSASMTGQVLAPTRGALTNYPKDVMETMDETWDRLAAEAKSGQSGPATTFMREIQLRGGEEIAPYLASSLVRHTESSNLDLADTLRVYQDQGLPGAVSLTERVLALPDRPYLTVPELRTFSESLGIDTSDLASHAAEAQQAAVSLLGEDVDIASIRLPLAEIAPGIPQDGGVATIDINMPAEAATVAIRHRSNGNTHTVNITMNMRSGEISVPVTSTIGIDENTRHSMQALIYRGLSLGATRQMQRRTGGLMLQGDGNMIHRSHEPTVAPSSGGPYTGRRPSPPTSASPPAVAEEAAPSRSIRVTGIDRDTVASMLDSQRIRDLTPEEVMTNIDKLQQAYINAGKQFGKPTMTELVAGGDRVKLCQINWKLGDSGRQVRLFFQVHPHGEQRLVGILDKKGGNQEVRYLRNLVASLRRTS